MSIPTAIKKLYEGTLDRRQFATRLLFIFIAIPITLFVLFSILTELNLPDFAFTAYWILLYCFYLSVVLRRMTATGVTAGGKLLIGLGIVPNPTTPIWLILLLALPTKIK